MKSIIWCVRKEKTVKRIISIFISIVILTFVVLPCKVNAGFKSNQYYDYVIPFVSDQTDKMSINGLSSDSLLKKGIVSGV